MNDPDDPIALARASFDAYVAKDRDAIEALIANEFCFTSPLDNCLDRETYFARCWPNSRTIESFDIVHQARAGECAFITYEGRNTSGGCFRNTEVFTVRQGKIVSVEVYFGWSVPHEAPKGAFVDDAK